MFITSHYFTDSLNKVGESWVVLYWVSTCMGECWVSHRIRLHVHILSLDEWNMIQLRLTTQKHPSNKTHIFVEEVWQWKWWKCWWSHHFLLEKERSQSFVEGKRCPADHTECSCCFWLSSVRTKLWNASYLSVLDVSLKEKPSATVAFNLEKMMCIQNMKIIEKKNYDGLQI